MSRNSDNFPQYTFSESRSSSTDEGLNYADPRFYQDMPAQKSRSTRMLPELTVQQQSTPHASGELGGIDGHATLHMSEYTGPASLENYTPDVGVEQREAAQRGSANGPATKKRLAGLGGLGATVLGLLIKFKALFMLLLEFKWVVILGQIGLGSFTALLSIGFYSLLFGWAFAVGLVGLLFVHEMGHAIVMKIKGVPIGGMIFIPMLGAAVIMRRMPRNARDEAEVGIAGPIAGALASGACLLIAQATSSPNTVWAPLAYFGFFMNLINLIPLVPLDGGRVMAAIDRRIWIIGFIGLIIVQIWEWLVLKNISSIWLLIFIILGGTQLLLQRKIAPGLEARSYYNVPLNERIVLGVAYFGLAIALALGMAMAHSLMPVPAIQ